MRCFTCLGNFPYHEFRDLLRHSFCPVQSSSRGNTVYFLLQVAILYLTLVSKSKQIYELGMDEGRATLMQMQIRRNAEDLQSYLKDLDSWENDIKQKDQGLTRHKPILKEVYYQ